jgi:endo-1,4-beta-D-glucanase Y
MISSVHPPGGLTRANCPVTQPTSYAYQWNRGGVAIPAATSSSYQVQNADLGLTISCTVTAVNAAGATAVVTPDVTVAGGSNPTSTTYALNDWTGADTTALYSGWKARNVDGTGAVVQRTSNLFGGDDTNGQGYNEVVSEGIGFQLRLAAQFDDQAGFDLTYKWAAANLQRTNAGVMAEPGGSNFSRTLGLNCFAWHYNWDTKTVVDADPAPDADMDIITGLLWADARWGSTGALDYLQLALNIAHDIMSYFFVTDSSTGFQYGPTMTEYEKGKTDPQDDNSYGDPTAFRLLVIHDPANATFWTNAINGWYRQLDMDTTYQVPGEGSPVGLPSDEVQIATTTQPFSVSSLNDPGDGYDAVKVPIRARWDWDFNGEDRAKAFLAGPAKAFLAARYSTSVGIPAAYSHDGSSNGGYENTLFHGSYFQFLTTEDESNTTGSSLYSNWLSAAKLYVVDSSRGGAYICDKPGYLNCGYFGDYWNLVMALMASGQLVDYR